jgi:hypothetical protein
MTRFGVHALLQGTEPTVKGRVQPLAQLTLVLVCTHLISRDKPQRVPWGRVSSIQGRLRLHPILLGYPLWDRTFTDCSI